MTSSNAEAKLIHDELRENGEIQIYLMLKMSIATEKAFMPQDEESVQDDRRILSKPVGDGENFVLRAERQRNSITFSCLKPLRTLCEASTLYVDVTFQFSCQFFS